MGVEFRGSLRMCLAYKKGSEFKIMGFCDSDYAADLDRRRSITCSSFLAGDCLISSKSSLQRVVVFSTTEAEYISMTEAAKEVIWLKGLGKDFGYEQEKVEVFCDSQSAVHHERVQNIWQGSSVS